MFGKHKDGMIDEMSDTFVDEMDVDSVDETKKFGSKGYFGKERYDRKDDHMCKDGHSHDADDLYEGSSPAYYDDTRYSATEKRAERELEKKSEGTHLCDDHEHREYKKPVSPAKDEYAPKYTAADFGRAPEEDIPSGTFNPDGGTNSGIPGGADESISGSHRAGPAASEAMEKSAEILYGSRTDSSDRSTGGSPTAADNEKVIYTVLVIMLIAGLCTGMFPLAIIAVIILVKMKRNTGKSDSDSVSRSTDVSKSGSTIIKALIVIAAIIVILIVINYFRRSFYELESIVDGTVVLLFK